MNECIFCKIIKGEVPSFKVFEDASHLAFLDINPINPGHLLVVPKSHIDYIFDLNDEAYRRILLFCKKLSGALKKSANSKRVGLAIEGFGVPHVHIHLVPINSANELDPRRSVKAQPKELEDMRNKIKNYLL